MLVLSRRMGEVVRLRVPPSATPTDVWVLVSEVMGESRARLAFDAPRAVEIHREEVLPTEERRTAS